jgi:nucleolar MIF4G domain-containing protein 1
LLTPGPAANFVQSTFLLYERYFQDLLKENHPMNPAHGNLEGEGKKCSNVLVLIAELYNIQVIASDLIFDIIRNILDKNISETNVELLLKVVQGSFSQGACPTLWLRTGSIWSTAAD